MADQEKPETEEQPKAAFWQDREAGRASGEDQ